MMNHQMIIILNDESHDIHGEDGYTLKAQRILSSLLDANTSLRIGKSGISVSYFNDKTTCLIDWQSENIFWRILKDLFVKRFSLIFQGSRPAGKDQPPKVYESFPVRVEENKIPVQHRGFGKPRREESSKLAAGSDYETFTRYLESIKHLERDVFWCQLHRPSVQDAGREVSAEETIESVENLPRVAGHLEHSDV